MRPGPLLAVALLAALGLAGCVTRGPQAPAITPPRAVAIPPAARPTPKLVRTIPPKPVKCVPDDLGSPPAYPDNDTALRDAGGAADRYQLLAAGRILRTQRLQRLEEVVKRCRNAAR